MGANNQRETQKDIKSNARARSLCAAHAFYDAVQLVFCIQMHGDSACDKTDHNVNKAAAEGAVVKISRVIAQSLWALL